tara:strand:+ start:1111 stop:2169 length:1059 start_codon:yes stop_codon:yes gene_type:complete
MKTPFVSIILVNYNGLDYTIDCMESLQKIDYPNYEIVVVDNGSKVDEGKIIKEKFPKARVFSMKKNKGYTGGANFGYKQTKGESIVLLNNDTTVEKNWLSELVKASQDPSVALTQSNIFVKYGKDDYHYDNNNGQSIIGCPLPNKEEFDEKGLKKPFLALGCSVLYPSKLFKEPFDEDYFCCCDDTALTFRARIMGYKIREVKSSIVYHEGDVVYGKEKNKKISKLPTYLKERNYILNLLIFYEGKTLLKMFPLIISAAILRNLNQIRGFPIRIKSYFWLLTNISKILEKRRRMQKTRKISDSALLKPMSCRFLDSERVHSKTMKGFVNIINKVSYIYCDIFNIRTSEFYKN